MTKYVSYYRVSTKKQGDSGLGLAAQERDIQLYFENYSGVPYEVVASFVEVESGTNSERKELTAAIAKAKECSATLLVAKLDRLSRKVSFIASLMEDDLLNLAIAQMPHADKFQLHIYAALAEQERDFISKRTKAALQEAKARGVKLGGLRDLTNQRNKASKEQAQARAEELRGIVEPMIAQALSFENIAQRLNQSGFCTVRGNEFKAMTVKRLADRLSN